MIGQFGVGFKSVFVYSDNPPTSGHQHFLSRYYDFVLPNESPHGLTVAKDAFSATFR